MAAFDSTKNDHTPEVPFNPHPLRIAERPLPLTGPVRSNVPALPPPGLSAGPDASSLLKALRRRWFLAGGAGAALAGIALVALWLLLPAKYQAFSLLQVSANRTSLGWGGEGRNDFPTYMKTQAGRIKSRDVLMKALNQDQVRSLRIIKNQSDTLTTLAWLEDNLKVDFQDGSELLTISLMGEEPGELVVIVNALTKSYLNIIGGQEKAVRKDRVDKMRMLYEANKEKLGEKVAARDALAKGQGGKDALAMAHKQATLTNQLQRAQELHQQIQFELEKKLIQLANLQASRKKLDNQPAPDFTAHEIQESDQLLKQDLADFAKLNKFVERMVAEGHPPTEGTLVQTQRKLDKLKKKIEDRTGELREEYTGRHRKKQEADLVAAIAGLQIDIAPLENQTKKLSDRVETLTKETEAINLTTARNQGLENEILQLETALGGLHGKLKGFEADEESENRVNPVGEAEWQNRDGKKRTLLLILGPLAALCAGVLTVAWFEFTARRIHGADEVEAGLAMRVIGAVPALPDPRRIAAHPEEEELYRHHLIESIDAIRTTLLRNGASDGIRVIMVTSAVGGEGKTTLASNLAMSLARAGRRTLLMDCDLRRPAAHQLLEQTLQPGFSEVVLNEVDLPDAVRPTTTDPNLYLLPAGHWDREVIQGLAKNGIESIFEKLKAEFDFVIVDSHPVLPATDSLLIGQHVDAVLVSLMRDVSQVHHVHSACQQLATLGIRLFGSVVNGVPVPTYGKGYNYTIHPQEQPAKVGA